MSTFNSAQLTRLTQNGTNYKQWKVMLEAFFLENGIYDLKTLSAAFEGLDVNDYNKDDTNRNIVKLESIAKRLIYSSIHSDHFAYVEGLTGFKMTVILEEKFSKSNENTPRIDKILKLFEWKQNNSNMIEYISMKRTLYADVNTNPPKDAKNVELMLPEEFLVAAVIMGLTDEMRKACMSWSNKKLATMKYLETKLSTGSAWNPIEINRLQTIKEVKDDRNRRIR